MKTRRKALTIAAGAAAAAGLVATASPALGLNFGDPSTKSARTQPAAWDSTGPQDIAADTTGQFAGDAWFAERGSASSPAAVGRYSPATNTIRYETGSNSATDPSVIGTLSAGARSEAIAVDSANDLVYVLLSGTGGASSASIARVDAKLARTDPNRVILCPLPGGFGSPRNITVIPTTGEVAITGGGAVGIWTGGLTGNCNTTKGTSVLSAWRSYDTNDSATGRNPTGIAFNPSNGLLYASMRDNSPVPGPKKGAVMVVDPSKATTDVTSDRYVSFTYPADAASTPSPGDITAGSSGVFWVNEDPVGSGPAYKVAGFPVGGDGLAASGVTFYSAGGDGLPRGIATDATGGVWYVDQGLGATPTATTIGRMQAGETAFTELATVPSSWNGQQDISFAGNSAFTAAKFAPPASGSADRGRVTTFLLNEAQPPTSDPTVPVTPPVTPPVVTPPVTPPVTITKITVSLKPKFAVIRKGNKLFLRVTGTATKSQAGRLVILERKLGKKTIRIGTAKITKAGKISKLIRVNTTTLKVRARIAGTAKAKAATTSFKTVKLPLVR